MALTPSRMAPRLPSAPRFAPPPNCRRACPAPTTITGPRLPPPRRPSTCGGVGNWSSSRKRIRTCCSRRWAWCPTRHGSTVCRCCRARRRCPATTAPAIPTAMTAPITAAPPMDPTGIAFPTPAVSMDTARQLSRRQRKRTIDVAGAPRKTRETGSENATTADLVAVLVAVTDGEPKIMTIANASALPSGPFEFSHRSLQTALRAWVEAQTGHPLGYVEQLYTFADRGRTGDAKSPHSISISYLGLAREDQVGQGFEAHWSGWYDYFPWEDHRAGPPALLVKMLTPRLRAWAKSAPTTNLQREWNEELVLQRYELLYEAALIPEAVRDRASTVPAVPGRPMTGDHRRILATGIARLRAKIKYRPVVFELMPAEFTLLQLQRSVEALAGRLVHKQNFRRLMEQQQLVEETGAIAADTVGRPAKLFRFRHAVLAERAVAGTKLPLSRT